MSLWRKKETVEEKVDNIVEKKKVSEDPIKVGNDRKIIDIQLSVTVEGGAMFVQRETKITKPVRPADFACIIAELEQLKMSLLTDYGRGKIASINKP